jgi:phytoene dehydrogenase-like protein
VSANVIVIGAGHNGLVAAARLAKGGLKPLVLERSDRIGGCAQTVEIAPGFRTSALAHRAAIDARIVRELRLERHGLQWLRPEALVHAPAADGRGLTVWADVERAAGDIAIFSEHDARKYPEFLESVKAVCGVLRVAISAPAPSIDSPGASDLLTLLKAGRRFRSLGKTNAYRLLRWMPMSVADFVREWFESEPLLATVAAGGLLGSFVGPRSAGSAAVLLLLAATDGQPLASGYGVRGGMGTLADALGGAAREAGAEIRTGADVCRILVRDGEAAGVVLSTGEEIDASLVISNVDPRRTLLGMVDPAHLSPTFARHMRHVRMRGTLAKINYAVSSLPDFASLAGRTDSEKRAALSGLVRLGPSLDGLERAFDAAKYGQLPDEPWLELSIPSIGSPDLAPAGQHVISAYALFAPYELRGTTWDAEREPFGDRATRVIETYAPGFTRSIVARHTITPLDLERDYGLTGGHIFHGELALDQLLAGRPLPGWSRYETPIRNLYLCGAGTHPGTGLDGRSGYLAAAEILRTGR